MAKTNCKTVQYNTKNKRGLFSEIIQKSMKNMKNQKLFTKVHLGLPKPSFIDDEEKNMQKIDPESLNIDGIKTICDIDNTFYNIVEGRAIRPEVDVKIYMRNLRDITLYKANAAYLNDQIKHIDKKIADELKLYSSIDKLYRKTKTNFFHFISEGYDIAKKTQERADAKSDELDNMIKQLDCLSLMHVKLNNEIVSLAATFASLYRYGKFLNEISPIWWKDKNDEQNTINFIQVYEEAESNPVDSFKIYKAYFINNKTPKIYFKKPQQLMRVFDTIRRQCLNYMHIQNCSAGILKPALKARDQLVSKILAELNEVTELIEYYEHQVKWMQEKEVEYTTKFNILLFKDFQELYASYEPMKLFTCIQYVHFCLFGGPTDPKDNIRSLTVNIEKLFIKLTSELDRLNQDVVKEIGNEIFLSDIRVMKRATKAHRSLKEFDILKKSLIASFEPPRYKHKK